MDAEGCSGLDAIGGVEDREETGAEEEATGP
jgi:hypothetical protein